MHDPKTTVASYTASGGLIFFGMSANDFAVLAGLALAVGTFLINWYYKHQHLKIIEDKVRRMPFPKLMDEED